MLLQNGQRASMILGLVNVNRSVVATVGALKTQALSDVSSSAKASHLPTAAIAARTTVAIAFGLKIGGVWLDCFGTSPALNDEFDELGFFGSHNYEYTRQRSKINALRNDF